MAELAKKFIKRAPRYLLRAKDNKTLRFALEGDSNHIYTTSLINISLTGMAFVTLKENSPKVGHIIKFELPVPGGEQVAWWGKVVRIEPFRQRPAWQKHSFNEDLVKEHLVAVAFERLPEKIKLELQQGLERRHRQLARQKLFQFRGRGIDFAKEHWREIALFAASILFTFLVLYFLSQPFGNYSPDRGAPWGQRFK